MSTDQIKRCFVPGNYFQGVGRLERLHVVLMTNLKVIKVQDLWEAPESQSFIEVIVTFESDYSQKVENEPFVKQSDPEIASSKHKKQMLRKWQQLSQPPQQTCGWQICDVNYWLNGNQPFC